MGFVKREVADNFVTIGDGDGDVAKAGGILTRFVPNNHFATPKTDYEFVNKQGELAILSGSASLMRQIHAEDLGKFFKVEFEGWGKSAKGAFKKIAVYLWDGEPTDEMRQWPRFSEYFGKQPKAQPALATATKIRDEFDKMPAALEKDDDDDLPF